MGLFGFRSGRDKLPWPVEENGEKEKAVFLKSTFDSPADAEMVISYLAAYGIPCFPHYSHEGGAGRIINGFSGYGADLYVPESRLEEARELLEARPMEEE